MREIIRTLPESAGDDLFKISLAGISYCDGTYRISRPNSDIYCFEYCISGKGTIKCDGNVCYPEKGDVYILQRGKDHFYFSDAQDPWTKIWFNIKGRLVDELVSAYGISNVNLIENCDAYGYFRRFLDNCEDRSLSVQSVCEKNLIIFHEFLQFIGKMATKAAVHNPDAELIKANIDRNIEKRMRISDLAALTHMSDSQIERVFYDNYGITPYSYILSEKLRVAKLLLKNTTLRIKDISEKLGFTDEHYFSYYFKKTLGISPRQYRNGGEK